MPGAAGRGVTHADADTYNHADTNADTHAFAYRYSLGNRVFDRRGAQLHPERRSDVGINGTDCLGRADLLDVGVHHDRGVS